MKKLILVTSSFLLFVSPKTLAAELKITVDEVKVYAQPNANSEVITTLFKGDAVKASNKPPAGFQKVLVKGGQIGYIKNADLAGGAKRPGQRPMARNQGRRVVYRSRGLRNRWSVSLMGGINYQRQGERSYVAADGSAASISALSGLSTVFGVQVQIPFTPLISAKGYLELKNVSVTGSATYQTNPAITAAPSDTYLNEQFLVVGAMGQYYLSPYFWAGAGLQLDHANSGTIKFSGYQEAALAGSDLPNFFMMYGSAGYDFEMMKNIYLVPEARIGALFSKPLIIEADALLNISYAF